MALKKYKPTTPSRRSKIGIDYTEIDKIKPLKSLTKGKKNSGGRNSAGRITVRHKGGGNKIKYRIIDFKRDKTGIPGKVEAIEYDPNRTCFLARILYTDGERRYIIAPQGIKKDMPVLAADTVEIKMGNTTKLANIPFGTNVHNIEMRPGKGGQMARSAGTFAKLVGRVDGKAQLKMPSGEMRVVSELCVATIGQVSNQDHSNTSLGKAGSKRWRGVRPTVRGVAMNPVDHPHGGGEGRTSGGRHPVSPWAVPTKGYKTRKNKRTNKDIIRRRPSGKR